MSETVSFRAKARRLWGRRVRWSQVVDMGYHGDDKRRTARLLPVTHDGYEKSPREGMVVGCRHFIQGKYASASEVYSNGILEFDPACVIEDAPRVPVLLVQEDVHRKPVAVRIEDVEEMGTDSGKVFAESS